MANPGRDRLRTRNSENRKLQSESPAFLIFDTLAKGQLASQGIFIAAELRIADYIKDGSKTVDELAKCTKTHPDSLYRLLRMLASIGIFREIRRAQGEQIQDNMRRFELTSASSLLLSDKKNSIRDFALLFGLDSFNKATTNLLYAIQTGKNSFKYANGLEMFEYFQKEQHRKDADIFDRAMTSLNLSYVSKILPLYDFSQFKTIIDIGGGRGMFLSTILKQNPHQYGILFDLPNVIARAKKAYWESTAYSNHPINRSILARCKLIAGDFLKSIPAGADCYIIKNVILNWDDQSAHVILENTLKAMKITNTRNSMSGYTKQRNARLVIIETIMPMGNDPFLGKFTDVLMLALTRGGRLRTEKEFNKLLCSSGFEIINVIKPRNDVSFLSMIEATPYSSD